MRNDTEFAQWLAYHQSLYPGLREWLAKLDKDRAAGGSGVVMAAWERLMKPVDLDTAKRCSDEMVLRDRQPRYERHAAEIVLIAKAHGMTSAPVKTPVFRDGQQTYRCRDCRDSGKASIYVVGDELVRAIRMFGPERSVYRSACVTCHCQGNSQVREWINSGQMIVQRHGKESFADLDPTGFARRLEQVEQAEAVLEAEDAAEERARRQAEEGPQPITAMHDGDF